MNAIIIDCETTGFLEPVEVIEFASTDEMPWPLFMTMGSVIASSRYCPSKEIENGAMAAHGIIREDLIGCSPWTAPTLSSSIGYVIGHGIDYDWRLIGSPDVKRIDTLALSRHLWPKETKHSLGALIYHIFSDKSQARELVNKAHGAKADVEMCYILLQMIIEIGQRSMPLDSWEDVWNWSELARVPITMWCGKHRGLPMVEVPKSYKSWALANMNDPPLDEWQRKALKG